MTKFELTCKCIRKTSKLFSANQRPDDETIETYAEVLQCYDINKIIFAISRILRTGVRFYPSCSDIIAEINPEVSSESSSQVMADNIWKISLHFGRHQQDEIRKALSASEIKSLSQFGLLTILDSDKSDIPILKAQLRKTCSSMMENEKVNCTVKKLGSLMNERDGITSLADAINQINLDKTKSPLLE